MKIKKPFFILLLILNSFVSYPQESDFGIWSQVNAETALADKLDFGLSLSLRTFRDASKIEQGFGEIGMSYRPLTFLTVAGSYRFINRLEDNNLYYPRHRFMADVRLRNDFGRLRISGRLRFQRQVRTYFEDAGDEYPAYYGRMRLKTVWRTRSFPVDPYLSFETFVRMFEQVERRFDKYRYTAGAEYSFNKKMSVELEYIFEKDYRPRLINYNILSVSWNLKL